MADTLWPEAVGPPPSKDLVPWLSAIPNAASLYAHPVSGTGYSAQTYDPRTISAETYSPETISSPKEDLFGLGPTAFGDIRVDPQTRSAQLAMLASMMRSFSAGGFDATERSQLEAALLTQRQAQTSASEGAFQEAQRRGLGNSAFALASSLFASQQAAQTASQQDMQIGLAAEQRHNQLRGDIAGVAGGIHAQDYKEQADRAAAIDAINRFNIDNKQQWAARAANRELTVRTQNQDATNKASQFNAGQTQAAATFNAGSQNDAARFNAGAQNDSARFAAQTAFDAARFNSQQTFDAERYNSQQAWSTNVKNSEIDQFNQSSAYNDAWARYQSAWKAADFWTQNPWAAAGPPNQPPPAPPKPKTYTPPGDTPHGGGTYVP